MYLLKRRLMHLKNRRNSVEQKLEDCKKSTISTSDEYDFAVQLKLIDLSIDNTLYLQMVSPCCIFFIL